LFDHIDFAVGDLPRSREFYVRLLAPLGIVPIVDIQRADGHAGTGFGADLIPRFWIGKGETVLGRLHIAFAAPSRESVAAFHAAGLEAGGGDHGAPGFRENYADNYYAAYIRDPDGHVVEAVCRQAEA
jgi:catechol 2,3-dioxygenase-like lactoylglutathione lyase family enzyme